MEEYKIYNLTNPIQYLSNAINHLRNIISLVSKEYSILHAISQVEYRKKHGLIHTLPTKKLNIFKSVYPNINNLIAISKNNYNYYNKINTPKSHLSKINKKVHFN